MTDDTVVRFTVSILVGLVVSAQSQQQCSPFCVCDSWYGLQRASCTGRHLNSIDTSAPDSVQALDLSDNVISLLSNYELMVCFDYKDAFKNQVNRTIFSERRTNKIEIP